MKKITVPTLTLTIAVLSGCQKNDVLISGQSTKNGIVNSQVLSHQPDADVKQCAITQISYQMNGTNDVMQFSYNADGDPVSITRQSGGHTGYPNYNFKYDEKNRLTDFSGPYNGNTAAEFWHHYYYDAPGNIIYDSTYIFPKIGNGYPENPFSRQATFYTYDNKKRIIRDSTVFTNNNAPVVHVYSYDDNGNKDGGSYDAHVNFNRTNAIWMFLNRDYSVNNSFNASAYNSNGFPSSGNNFLFLGIQYSNVQIAYACDSK